MFAERLFESYRVSPRVVLRVLSSVLEKTWSLSRLFPKDTSVFESLFLDGSLTEDEKKRRVCERRPLFLSFDLILSLSSLQEKSYRFGFSVSQVLCVFVIHSPDLPSFAFVVTQL